MSVDEEEALFEVQTSVRKGTLPLHVVPCDDLELPSSTSLLCIGKHIICEIIMKTQHYVLFEVLSDGQSVWLRRWERMLMSCSS